MSSSTGVGRLASAVKSTTLTVGVGTRRLKPSNVLSSSGMTRASARVALLVAGTKFWSAARARRGSLWVRVERTLRRRVAVDRVHQPPLDRHEVVDDLDGADKAVRRARGVADDVVPHMVVAILVDAEVAPRQRSRIGSLKTLISRPSTITASSV